MTTPSDRDYLLLRAYQAGITDPRELSVFMGQMEIESQRFSRMHEGFGYRPERLLDVFRGRNGINTLEEARAVVQGGPEGIANAVYGGEWGRRDGGPGNTEPGDGWRYHGRGYVQLTGRYNYETLGRELGMDFAGNPDLVADREIAANVALHYWSSRVVAQGNQQDVRGATLGINGGYRELPERTAAAERWERALTPEIMQGLSRGEVLLLPMPGQVQDDDVLRQGERGPAVRALQENLSRLGVTDAQGRPLDPDDHYGQQTREAVQAFQHSSMGLIAADGIAGPDTIKAVQDRVDALNPLHGVEQVRQQFQTPGARSDWMQADQQGVPNYLQARNVPRPVPDPMSDGVLRPGERGPAVGELQTALNAREVMEGRAPSLKVDNSYGPATRREVESFQMWNGLDATGIADRETLNAVRHVQAPSPNNMADAADLRDPSQGYASPFTAPAPSVPGRKTVTEEDFEHLGWSAPAGTPPAPTPDAGPPTMANPVQSHGPRAPHDPRDPTHPDHALYEQIRIGVEKLDAQHGRGFDATSERMSLSLLTLAKETGITRVDEVVLSRQTSALPAGATVFLVQGDRSNEAMHRESMPTAVATQTPPEKSMQQLEVVNQQITQQQELARQQELTRGPDDPSRGGPKISM